MNDIPWDELLATAREAMKKAYAPYSHYQVGAALLTEDGTVYTGVNVENASYGLTICAERTAAVKAVSEGKLKWKALAVVSSGSTPGSPCGACRQFLREFSTDLPIMCGGATGEGLLTSIDQLLPRSFGPEFLNRK
jgi:cytidine deaminase